MTYITSTITDSRIPTNPFTTEPQNVNMETLERKARLQMKWHTADVGAHKARYENNWFSLDSSSNTITIHEQHNPKHGRFACFTFWYVEIYTQVARLLMRLFSKPCITLRNSSMPHAGTGVFATETIPKGTVVERCRMLITSCTAPEGDDLWSYVMKSPWNDNESIVGLGNALMYNHNVSPNTKHVNANRQHRTIEMVTTRDVKKDEELFVDYGHDFWYGPPDC